MTTQTDTVAETHPFQAEVAELLRLMVHAVYSETDVFLRELISNASDACDKLRYAAIARPELLEKGGALVIRIKPDKDAGTLTVGDTGIGMDRQELIDELGTVARSGTRAFISGLAQAQDGSGLIGQFGVGFYAAFMVSDRIEVISRRAGSNEAWVWRASGGTEFEIMPATDEQANAIPRGTEVILHLKEDAKKYLDTYDLERIVRTYSDHILFPIELVGNEGALRQINKASAIWQRPKSELKPEDYKEAYRTIAGGFDEPAMTLHYRAEGRQSYAVLLFAPSSTPFDLNDPARRSHIKLYVRRVYITSDAELLPPYLRFMRGVVDSEDMPLNISREMLQNNPQVAQIRKALTARVLTEMENLVGKEPEAYAKIWDAFGKVLKEGIYEDYERRNQLLALARFVTTTSATPRSLKEYVADLKLNQTEIYYLVGESAERLKANPKLEAARARGNRGFAVDRSGRRAVDIHAGRLRRQAAQVIEPGRSRFQPGATAGTSKARAARGGGSSRRRCGGDCGGQRRPGRSRIGRTCFATVDGQPRLSRRDRRRLRSRAHPLVGEAEPRRPGQAGPGAEHAPCHGHRDCVREAKRAQRRCGRPRAGLVRPGKNSRRRTA